MNIVVPSSAMALSHNMAVFSGHSKDTYEPGYPFSSFSQSSLPAQRSSTSSFPHDLSGFRCKSAPALLESVCLSSTKRLHGPESSRRALLDRQCSVYPSPPSTSSEPMQNVPLPSESAHGEFDLSSFLCNGTFGGVLDSPLVMLHEALKHDAPISPPPTNPTSTYDLPPATDHDLPRLSSALEHMGLPYFITCMSPTDEADTTNPLLSPISPEWPSQMTLTSPGSSPDHFYLLSGVPSSPHSDLDSSATLEELPVDGPSGSRPRLLQLDIPTNYPSPESDNTWGDRMDTQPDGAPLPPPLIVSHSYPYSPASPSAKPLDIDQDIPLDDPLFDTHQTFPHPSSPSIHFFNDLPDFDDVTLDSPFSPSRRSFSSLPELDFNDEDGGMLSPPSSPGISVLSLPGAEVDDVLIPDDFYSAHEHEHHAVDMPPLTPYNNNHSLLLLDDPNDVPPPRSPSPENFTIDPAVLADCDDPELQGLYDLRKKAQAAEWAARQNEARIVDEDGPIQAVAETRRAIKREKGRGREVSTLLRLKLSERGINIDTEHLGGASSPSRKKKVSKKPKITNMPQLVANMIISRHEPRPMGNRRPSLLATGSERYPNSPLSRPIVISPRAEEVGGLSLDDEWSTSSWLDHPPPFAMDVDHSALDLLSPL